MSAGDSACVRYFFLQEVVYIILISNPVIFHRHEIWDLFSVSACFTNFLREPQPAALWWIRHVGNSPTSYPPPTCESWVDGVPCWGHTESPPKCCLCLAPRLPDSWSRSHLKKMSRNPPLKKNAKCHRANEGFPKTQPCLGWYFWLRCWVELLFTSNLLTLLYTLSMWDHSIMYFHHPHISR